MLENVTFSQVPNKQGILINRGLQKTLKCNKQGSQNKQGYWNFRNGFKMIIKHWKEQTQIVIKHSAKTYTEAFNFTLNIGREYC